MMDEYINRRYLLDAIEHIDWYHCNRDGKLVSGAAFEHDAFIRYDTTESVINAIPAADAIEELSKPRWIPMAERLPKDKQNCLCHGKYGGIRVLCFTKNLRQIDKYDFADKRRPGWFYFDSEWGYCEALGITHWMPLPEPPKEKTDDYCKR